MAFIFSLYTHTTLKNIAYLCHRKPEKTTYSYLLMKKTRLLFAAFLLALCPLLRAAAPKTNISHVHPKGWWAGMHNPRLQILIHGTGLEGLTPELRGGLGGVRIEKVIRPENPHYLILYVNTAQAQAQTFHICLVRDANKKKGKKMVVKEIPFELRERKPRGMKSFDAGDVLYLLMPDRFATGTTDAQKVQMYKGMKEDHWGQADMERRGGDLAGMRKHLDYLQELGITAIWPTPTLVNDMEKESYHGYAITDYYETDPRLGTNEEYRTWVQECHEHGIKVVKDIVFNHCASENFLFKDKPQKDWFSYDSQYVQTTYKTATPGDPHASVTDRKLTIDGWFTQSMPDLNGRNPLVADYLIQTSLWWIEYAGIDGIRQDTYPYNDFGFMRRWCEEIEAAYPGFNIVGETWINNPVAVSYWQKDSPLAAKDKDDQGRPMNSQLRTVMDFPLMYMLTSCVDEETDTWDHGFARLCDLIGQDRVYADPNSVLTFLANHDTNRFQRTEEEAQNITRYKQALALLLTLRGIPQLYYGDEIGMYANKSVNDGALRQMFPERAFRAEGRTALQQEYFDYTKRLLNWRKGNEAIARGRMVHFTVRNGVYVYARIWKDKVVTVLANGTGKEAEVDTETYREVLPRHKAHEVISGQQVNLTGLITLAPKQIMIIDN